MKYIALSATLPSELNNCIIHADIDYTLKALAHYLEANLDIVCVSSYFSHRLRVFIENRDLPSETVFPKTKHF